MRISHNQNMKTDEGPQDIRGQKHNFARRNINRAEIIKLIKMRHRTSEHIRVS